jgi:anoctamin-10
MLACVRGYNTDIEDLNDENRRKFTITRLLIEQGSNLKMYAKDGINNPLHWACYFGDIYTAKLLVDNLPGLSNIL